MRYFLLITIVLCSCHSTKNLPSGLWSGYLSPMNQPHIQTSLSYRITHVDENISLQIFGPGGINIPTKNIQLTEDTLFFSFNKQNEQVLINCALQKLNENFYCGRCTDPEGKWSSFSMQYNSKNEKGLGRHGKGIRCACHG